MDESTLKALIQLFAIISHAEQSSNAEINKGFVHTFLSEQFGHKNARIYIAEFDKYLQMFEVKQQGNSNKYLSNLYIKLINICQKLNLELSKKQKFLVLIKLLIFIRTGENNSRFNTEFIDIINEYIKTIAETLLIDESEYLGCRYFIDNKIDLIPEKQKMLLINNQSDSLNKGNLYLYQSEIEGRLLFLYIASTKMILVQYHGSLEIEFNSNTMRQGSVYILGRGSVLKADKIRTIYYSSIFEIFLREHFSHTITFSANRVEYFFPNSSNGIHPFSFSAQSGQLVGIMGASGVGKSTFLNILNGKIKVNNGTIDINGIDIHDKSEKLNGIIGYVPQDDLLFDDLSVYDNMYYSACLSMGNLPDKKIKELVNTLLSELDLYEIRNLKAGTPLNKYISGGERKRLNLALELIREPYVVFIDEPTSGLSSSDSEKVMQLLKNKALSGKLIIANIHQPSSEIFKILDRLLVLDKGGYLIFQGNPIEAVSYFKTKAGLIKSYESECPQCGNVNPEEILNIIESHDVNEYGENTANRKIRPRQWYEHYLEEIEIKNEHIAKNKILPNIKFKKASKLKQFVVFLLRNILSKIADRQYWLMAMSVPPLLAVILGYFTKYIHKTPGEIPHYSFLYNENLPAFLFMSIIVALFVGMIMSAEEIYHDRKILARESFLKLSRISYFNSKILILFVISFLQVCIYVFITNYILEIEKMHLTYILVLFSTACFANLAGLILSNYLKSMVAIYIAIPLILIPQILLGGVIVKYDKLHDFFSSEKFTPLAGDLMTSRWAFEALAVSQFANNPFQSKFIDIESAESNYSYNSYFVINELSNKLDECELLLQKDTDSLKVKKLYQIVLNEMNRMEVETKIFLPISLPKNLKTPEHAKRAKSGLQYYKNSLFDSIDSISEVKSKLIASFDSKELVKSKEKNTNEALNNLLLNTMEISKTQVSGNELIRKFEPVYQTPDSHFGRAHFFALKKQFGGFLIETLNFNIAIIWFMVALMYLALITDCNTKWIKNAKNIFLKNAK